MTIILGLILTFTNAMATSHCTYLFETTTNVKIYPTLSDITEIKKAQPKKTHLKYFEPYVHEAIEKLARKKTLVKGSNIEERIDKLGAEAFARLASKAVTYEWIWNFTTRLLQVFDDLPVTDGFKNFDKIMDAFPDKILIPTFSDLSFRDYIEIENKHFGFVGIRDKPQFVDGSGVEFVPSQFANHDFLHYYLSFKSDSVLSSKNKNHETWLNLHSKIKSQISLLPEWKRQYVEFIYFYILHEEFGLRDKLVETYLNRSTRAMSQYIETTLKYTHIKEYLEGKSYIHIHKSDLYKRMHRPNDFMTAFPNKNPQEVLLVGLEEFINILRNIESETK